MSYERQEFSRRLAEAMQAAGYAPRPAVLFRLFNAHYRGRSVTFQSASRWLGGRSIPEQDKLQVLAAVLGVEPHVLRFGTGKSRVAETRVAWPSMTGIRDRQAIEAFLALPVKHRELIAELMRALAKR
jgi:transcriptional regulator with XRE-family HTH domain